MIAFYILKPDMLKDRYFFEKYLYSLQNELNVKNLGFYTIDDWVEISKYLYDIFPTDTHDDDIIEIRKKRIITILGYYHYYKNDKAILHLYETSDNQLFKLEEFKKKYRKDYVYDREKYYLYIANQNNISYNHYIKNMDLSDFNVDYQFFKKDEKCTLNDYQLIYFNKIHFPDPNKKSIERDLDIIDSFNVINDNNKVKKLGGIYGKKN